MADEKNQCRFIYMSTDERNKECHARCAMDIVSSDVKDEELNRSRGGT